MRTEEEQKKESELCKEKEYSRVETKYRVVLSKKLVEEKRLENDKEDALVKLVYRKKKEEKDVVERRKNGGNISRKRKEDNRRKEKIDKKESLIEKQSSEKEKREKTLAEENEFLKKKNKNKVKEETKKVKGEASGTKTSAERKRKEKEEADESKSRALLDKMKELSRIDRKTRRSLWLQYHRFVLHGKKDVKNKSKISVDYKKSRKNSNKASVKSNDVGDTQGEDNSNRESAINLGEILNYLHSKSSENENTLPLSLRIVNEILQSSNSSLLLLNSRTDSKDGFSANFFPEGARGFPTSMNGCGEGGGLCASRFFESSERSYLSKKCANFGAVENPLEDKRTLRNALQGGSDLFYNASSSQSSAISYGNNEYMKNAESFSNNKNFTFVENSSSILAKSSMSNLDKTNCFYFVPSNLNNLEEVINSRKSANCEPFCNVSGALHCEDNINGIQNRYSDSVFPSRFYKDSTRNSNYDFEYDHFNEYSDQYNAPIAAITPKNSNNTITLFDIYTRNCNNSHAAYLNNFCNLDAVLANRKTLHWNYLLNGYNNSSNNNNNNNNNSSNSKNNNNNSNNNSSNNNNSNNNNNNNSSNNKNSNNNNNNNSSNNKNSKNNNNNTINNINNIISNINNDINNWTAANTTSTAKNNKNNDDKSNLFAKRNTANDIDKKYSFFPYMNKNNDNKMDKNNSNKMNKNNDNKMNKNNNNKMNKNNNNKMNKNNNNKMNKNNNNKMDKNNNNKMDKNNNNKMNKNNDNKMNKNNDNKMNKNNDFNKHFTDNFEEDSENYNDLQEAVLNSVLNSEMTKQSMSSNNILNLINSSILPKGLVYDNEEEEYVKDLMQKAILMLQLRQAKNNGFCLSHYSALCEPNVQNNGEQSSLNASSKNSGSIAEDYIVEPRASFSEGAAESAFQKIDSKNRVYLLPSNNDSSRASSCFRSNAREGSSYLRKKHKFANRGTHFTPSVLSSNSTFHSPPSGNSAVSSKFSSSPEHDAFISFLKVVMADYTNREVRQLEKLMLHYKVDVFKPLCINHVFYYPPFSPDFLKNFFVRLLYSGYSVVDLNTFISNGAFPIVAIGRPREEVGAQENRLAVVAKSEKEGAKPQIKPCGVQAEGFPEVSRRKKEQEEQKEEQQEQKEEQEEEQEEERAYTEKSMKSSRTSLAQEIAAETKISQVTKTQTKSENKTEQKRIKETKSEEEGIVQKSEKEEGIVQKRQKSEKEEGIVQKRQKNEKEEGIVQKRQKSEKEEGIVQKSQKSEKEEGIVQKSQKSEKEEGIVQKSEEEEKRQRGEREKSVEKRKDLTEEENIANNKESVNKKAGGKNTKNKKMKEKGNHEGTKSCGSSANNEFNTQKKERERTALTILSQPSKEIIALFRAMKNVLVYEMLKNEAIKLYCCSSSSGSGALSHSALNSRSGNLAKLRKKLLLNDTALNMLSQKLVNPKNMIELINEKRNRSQTKGVIFMSLSRICEIPLIQYCFRRRVHKKYRKIFNLLFLFSDIFYLYNHTAKKTNLKPLRTADKSSCTTRILTSSESSSNSTILSPKSHLLLNELIDLKTDINKNIFYGDALKHQGCALYVILKEEFLNLHGIKSYFEAKECGTVARQNSNSYITHLNTSLYNLNEIEKLTALRKEENQKCPRNKKNKYVHSSFSKTTLSSSSEDRQKLTKKTQHLFAKQATLKSAAPTVNNEKTAIQLNNKMNEENFKNNQKTIQYRKENKYLVVIKNVSNT